MTLESRLRQAEQQTTAIRRRVDDPLFQLQVDLDEAAMLASVPAGEDGSPARLAQLAAVEEARQAILDAGGVPKPLPQRWNTLRYLPEQAQCFRERAGDGQEPDGQDEVNL